MSFSIDLQIASESTDIPKEDAFQLWVTTALSKQKTSAEVSIRIVDEAESQSLNAQYRGKDYPTNVLSFPAEFPEGIEIDFIGDLVICAPVVIREANEQNKALAAHWAHMTVHGCLHLIGFDHIEDDEAEEMETLESQLLSTLGYPCPYKMISEVDGAGSHC